MKRLYIVVVILFLSVVLTGTQKGAWDTSINSKTITLWGYAHKDSSNTFTRLNIFVDTITGNILTGASQNIVEIIQHINPDSIASITFFQPFKVNATIDSLSGEEIKWLFYDGIVSEMINYSPDTVYILNGGKFRVYNRKGYVIQQKGLSIVVSNSGVTVADTPRVNELAGMTLTLTNASGAGGGEVASSMRPILIHVNNYDSVYVAYGTDILFYFDTLSYTYRVWGSTIGFDDTIKGTIGSDIIMLNINAPILGPTGVIGDDLYGILVHDMSGANDENYSIKSLGANYLASAEIDDSIQINSGNWLKELNFGSDAFGDTKTADTVLISGATINDMYLITAKDSIPAGYWTTVAKPETLIINSSVAENDTPYSWWRFK